MPKVRKIDPEKVKQLKGREKKYFDMLTSLRDSINGQMKYLAEDALDASNADKRGVTTHMADMDSDNARHEMELKMLTEEGNVIELIEDAIDRILAGEFGKCSDCGGPIPDARLDVRPYAIYCVKCKSQREKNGQRI